MPLTDPPQSISAAVPSKTQTALQPNIKVLMETALQIAKERKEILEKMRAALEAGDNIKALDLARGLCGLDHGEKGNRTDSRIN